ncbi:adenylyltransferase/cytidyltransferase family protein [Micrococcales bacterium 31B]|nr:adenylyltransferase/cytidyltransferase family protein [Micrococcales bacterium 31B]
MRVLTYGTFDTLHHGHLNLLRQARDMGDELIVGLSTNEFNAIKGKRTFQTFQERVELLSLLRPVDYIIPETNWRQKPEDILTLEVDLVVMGEDWERSPHFEDLARHFDVRFLPRTPGISSTQIKQIIHSSGARGA